MLDGPVYIYAAALRRVIDADTLLLDVDLGFRVSAAITVRLVDVDAPERNTPEGKAASAFVTDLLVSRGLLVRSYRGQQSFARWVCAVWLRTDAGAWLSVTQALLDAGHARRAL